MARDLEVFELGNHGIDPGAWTGWHGPSERVPQGYPQPGDLPPQPATADAQWPQMPPARSSANCWCRSCRPITPADMRFVVCPDCGNKRCPKANHHDHACTRSNATGQPGSAYPAGQLEAEIARSARVSLIECGVALVLGLALGFGLCLLTPWSPL